MKKKNQFLILITLVAAFGGILFGFDIAIITGANPFLEQFFHLDEKQLGLGTSALLFGCIPGAIIAGRVTDIFGRKVILMVVAIFFAVTTILTGLSPSFSFYVAIRFIGGFAVGAASLVSPMYIAEMARPSIRGRLVSVYQLSIVFGILISYMINLLLRDVPHNWSWMFISGAVPSAILFIMLFFVPETPRYLFKKGLKDQAMDVLNRLMDADEASREYGQMEHSFSDATINWRNLFGPKYRFMMIVGLGLAVFVQVSGITAVIDYAPKILEKAGWDINSQLFGTFGLGLVNVAFTFVSIWAIDKFGRKPLYLIGSAGMTLALAALTFLSFNGMFEGPMVFVICIIYIAFFASCIGPVFWTLMSELFPNKVRGTAMAFPVFTQWIFNALMVLVFPHFFVHFKVITFGIITLMAFSQLLFAWRFVPETKGKTLEEIEELWK